MLAPFALRRQTSIPFRIGMVAELSGHSGKSWSCWDCCGVLRGFARSGKCENQNPLVEKTRQGKNSPAFSLRIIQVSQFIQKSLLIIGTGLIIKQSSNEVQPAFLLLLLRIKQLFAVIELRHQGSAAFEKAFLSSLASVDSWTPYQLRCCTWVNFVTGMHFVLIAPTRFGSICRSKLYLLNMEGKHCSSQMQLFILKLSTGWKKSLIGSFYYAFLWKKSEIAWRYWK